MRRYKPGSGDPAVSRRFAPERFAPERFAPERFAHERFAPERYALERYAPERYAPERSALFPFGLLSHQSACKRRTSANSDAFI